MKRKPTIREAIDYDSYEWLNSQNLMLLEAVQGELEKGATPEMIRLTIMGLVGPERASLALRCEQAARYLMGPGMQIDT